MDPTRENFLKFLHRGIKACCKNGEEPAGMLTVVGKTEIEIDEGAPADPRETHYKRWIQIKNVHSFEPL